MTDDTGEEEEENGTEDIPVDSNDRDLRYSPEVLGYEEPVRRKDNLHPVTGRQDTMRANKGNRYRIENLEFKLGHLICGKFNNYTGEYCTEVPVPNEMRCEKHYSKTPENIKKGSYKNLPYSPGMKYGMELNAFLHCRTCMKKDCPYFTRDPETDECVLERHIYEELMDWAEQAGIDENSFKYRMIQMLAWDVVKNFRAENIVARDGYIVKEVTGYKAENGDVGFLHNDREHPVLKHMPKFQESIIKLARELEVTPKAETQKQGTDEEARKNDMMEDLLKDAHNLRRNTDGETDK